MKKSNMFFSDYISCLKIENGFKTTRAGNSTEDKVLALKVSDLYLIFSATYEP